MTDTPTPSGEWVEPCGCGLWICHECRPENFADHDQLPKFGYCETCGSPTSDDDGFCPLTDADCDEKAGLR